MTPPPVPVPVHAKDAGLYMSTSKAGALALVALLNKYTLDMSCDYVDTTAFGDVNKTSVKGLPSYKGNFEGFWSEEDETLFDAAASADGCKLQIFPKDGGMKNFGGPAWVDASIDGSTTTAVTIKGTFNANGAWARDGAPPA
jgi:hypothetical protein